EGDDPDDQRPGHRAVDGRIEKSALVENRRGLVQGAPPLHRLVHDRHADEGSEGGDRTALRAHLGVVGNPAQRQVAEIEHEERGRHGGERQPADSQCAEDAGGTGRRGQLSSRRGPKATMPNAVYTAAKAPTSCTHSQPSAGVPASAYSVARVAPSTSGARTGS